MRYCSLAFALGLVATSAAPLAAGSDSVIALSTDNDLFAPGQTDRDYTAGVAVTYSSNSADFNNSQVSRLVYLSASRSYEVPGSNSGRATSLTEGSSGIPTTN